MSTQTTVTPIHKTVSVSQPPDQAFAMFTAGLDQWWPQGVPATGTSGAASGSMVLEPRPEGRIYRRHDDGTIEFRGDVRIWDPPHRLVLGWQPAPGAAALTEIEVRFTAEEGGTRVDLEHRGWDQLGGPAAVTRAGYESGWADALSVYAAGGRDNGAAIAALILGIFSVVLPLLGILAAPFAIGFGIAGRRRARRGARQGGLATAGLTLGAIGLVLWGVIGILGASVITISSGHDESPVPVETHIAPPPSQLVR